MKPKIYKTDYYVNEKKKTVTCVLCGYTEVGCDSKLLEIRVRNEGIIDPLVWGDGKIIRDYMDFSVCATTRCTEDDEFNVELGKKIALQKAKIKLYKEMTKLNYAVHLAVAKSTMDDLRKYEKLSVCEYLEYEKNVLGIELPKKISIKTDDKEYVLTLCLNEESLDVVYCAELDYEGVTHKVPVFRTETFRDMRECLEENKDRYTVVSEGE